MQAVFTAVEVDGKKFKFYLHHPRPSNGTLKPLVVEYMKEFFPTQQPKIRVTWSIIPKTLDKIIQGVPLYPGKSDCPICFEVTQEKIVFSCRHSLCENCAKELLKKTFSCPLCRANILESNIFWM